MIPPIGSKLIEFYEDLRADDFGHKDSFELAEFAQNHLYDLEKEYQRQGFYTAVYLIMRRTVSVKDAEVSAKSFCCLVFERADELAD